MLESCKTAFLVSLLIFLIELSEIWLSMLMILLSAANLIWPLFCGNSFCLQSPLYRYWKMFLWKISLIFVGGPLVIVIGCIIFLSLLLDTPVYSQILTLYLFQNDVALFFEPFWKPGNVADVNVWCFIKLNDWAFQWKKNEILWPISSNVMALTIESEIAANHGMWLTRPSHLQ